MEQITLTLQKGGTTATGISVDQHPNICPLCHLGMQATVVAAFEVGRTGNILEAVFRCSIRDCSRMFIATYEQKHTVVRDGLVRWILIGVAPQTPEGTTFPEGVARISPVFVELFDQSAEAEIVGLDGLAGMGYRKSLEYLIKDFLISTKPDDESFASLVKTKMLGHCINEFVDDPRIKLTASRAAWLGNDETHYERKWVEQDVNDLKVLIRLTVNWIDSHMLTHHYEKAMPKGR